MKGFVKNSLYFFIPLLLLSVTAEFLLRNIPNNYQLKNDQLESKAAEIELLILGNSHAHLGINPKYLSEKSFNSAQVSQSLNYNYAILEKFKPKLNNLKSIVLSISYQSLLVKMETGKESWRTKNYKIYYGIDTCGNFNSNFELMANKADVNLERIIDYYFKGKSEVTSDESGWGYKRLNNRKEDFEKMAKLTVKRHTIHHNKHLKENLSILTTIAKWANENEIKLYLVVAPVYKTYFENTDPKQVKLFKGVLKKLERNNNSVFVYDCFNHPDFNKKDFFDGDHLNNSGAKKFTILLNDFIKSHYKK